jgi:glyoxylase-like metal-dependent hydrolase (beta-lactamase superfamily II)
VYDQIVPGFVRESFNDEGTAAGTGFAQPNPWGAYTAYLLSTNAKGQRTWRVENYLPNPNGRTAQGSTMYLFEGRDRALLVDTAQNTVDEPGRNDLKTVVRYLLGHENDGRIRTPPVDFVVANTHSHGDHTGKNALMSDRTVYYPDLDWPRRDAPANYVPIKEGGGKTAHGSGDAVGRIELGDRTIEAIDVPCHTPGSTAYLDRENALIATGDAIGSAYVWAQFGFITQYDATVHHLQDVLRPFERVDVLPAHFYQVKQGARGKPPLNGRPLDKTYVDDQVRAADGILDGSVVGVPYPVVANTLIATVGSAQIVYRPDRIRPPATFNDDVTFLRAHTDVIVLSGSGGAAVAIAPGYQGRVMTSTAAGPDGASFGYLHRPGIEAGTRQPHMTVLGGEDRLWIGPEGGQYGLYFPPGRAFDTDAWQVPEPIDWGAWPVSTRTDHDVSFSKTMTLENYSGTRFDLRVDRTIRLLDASAVQRALGVTPGAQTRVVAYESDNRITNTGAKAWSPSTGLLSIWILGQLRPAPRTTIVLPYQPGAVATRGPVMNDAYFGAPPASRLHAGDHAIFFRADGAMRGKIGLPHPRARDVAGSYDPESRVLTLIQFTHPATVANGYVNSMWEHQARPYDGDVVNAYNDGPLGPGQPPLGPFYEIESSSPAAALAPQASMQHVHRTIHLQGPEGELDAVARAVLGVSLAEITGSLAAR